MVEDIITAASLLIIGTIALVISGRGRQIRQLYNRFLIMIRSLGDIQVWRHAWGNFLLRLFFFLLLLIMSGWAATLSQVGLHATQKAITFEDPSPGAADTIYNHEFEACYQTQQRTMEDIIERAYTEKIPVKPGFLPPGLGEDCPFGGTYSISRSGILCCSRHGSPPDNPPIGRLHFEEENR